VSINTWTKQLGKFSEAPNDRVDLDFRSKGGLRMERFMPLELLSYFLIFENHFSKPNFIYFQGYLWGLLLARGRKTMNNIAHCCFWVERSLSSWERFLSENVWDVNAVGQTLVDFLLALARKSAPSPRRISGWTGYFISAQKWSKNVRSSTLEGS